MSGPGGVWVYAEPRLESVWPVSLEILGRARGVADALGERLVVVTAGSGEGRARELARYGADEVAAFDHPLLERYDTRLFTELLAREVQAAGPSVLLLGATRDGQDLAGRLAVRLRTGLTAHVTSLEVDAQRRLVGWVPGFGAVSRRASYAPTGGRRSSPSVRASFRCPPPGRPEPRSDSCILPWVRRMSGAVASPSSRGATGST